MPQCIRGSFLVLRCSAQALRLRALPGRFSRTFVSVLALLLNKKEIHF